KSGTTGRIQIKFVSEEGLKAIDLSNSPGWLNKEFKNDTKSYAKVKDNVVYVNSDLSGPMRTHFILLGMLFELGFKGETLKYQDSLFYYRGTTTTSLSAIDEKAVQIMYGLGLYNGMTVEDVKKRVFIKSS
ncbi:MAG: hypothetical protein LUQ25_04405, partial [Methanoregulaceae archaeon]|nr:hypothetical protein [Methanoregulaceae archaeon]